MIHFELMADAKTYDNVVVTNLEHSEIEITGEIPSEYFTPFRNKAIKKLGDKTKIDGFRSGHIPEKILLERISEQVVLEEAAEMALSQVYPKIVADKKLSVIGYPQITLTKLAKGNPLGYKIKTAVIPEFELPPYTNIAQEVMSKKEIIEVNEKEIDDVILDIRKTRAQSEKKQQTQPNKDTDVNTLVDAQGNPLRTKESEVSDINLPPLNDETVKTFGDFKDIADFRNRLKENMIKEKGLRAKDKKRAELSDALISKTTIDLPNILVESELDKMLGQLKDDISRMNMKYEDYLAHMKKTEGDLRKEWHDSAQKRAKLQLLLNNIAEKENMHPDRETVDHQVKQILEQYKEAKEDRARIYVESMLTNELVFAFLEGQK